ncbi:MAG: diacylglycerol kinase family protein, partial [Gemmataceae bacterium]
FRGVGRAAREERSFRVHMAAAGLVLIAAAGLRCEPVEWCLLVGCVGAVFAAETFNASIETLFHALDDATKARMTGCLDRAAGAVLLTAGTSAVIGAIVFGRRFIMLTGW